MSEHLWHCNSVIQSSSKFWYERRQLYENFGHFFLSMLQNFLGQVISLSNIYLSIEENVNNNNTYGIHYDVARITRLLTIFDPVELVEDQLVYNPSQEDIDSIPDPDVNQQIFFASQMYDQDGHPIYADNGPLYRAVESTFSEDRRGGSGNKAKGIFDGGRVK